MGVLQAKAKPVLIEKEPLTASSVATCRDEADTSETVSGETVREVGAPERAKAEPTEEPALFTALKRRTPTAVREVDSVLDQVELSEFGPAEQPLRELATISVLTRHGITTEQVHANRA